MAVTPKPSKIVFRDKRGRFLKAADRYTSKVARIERHTKSRGSPVVQLLAERSLPPDRLADLLSQREFGKLPEAMRKLKKYTSTSKYKAWDIAEQIDKTKGLRRKELKVTVTVLDGKQKKQITFYHKIKRNTPSSYAIFRRINQEIGMEGWFIYRTAGGKLLADRTGKKVKLVDVQVDEIV